MLHYENLHLYLRLGLKLKKKYRKLEFNQSKWLKPYIEFNTQKRIDAKKKYGQRWKRVVQINEQCCIWKNMDNLMKKTI